MLAKNSKNAFQRSTVLVLGAIIGIWLATARPEKALSFDARATVGPCPAADAEPGEFDIVLEVRQLSVNAAKPP